MPIRIALLEDDPDQGVLVQAWLEESGYRCDHFATAQDFQLAIQNTSYDLLVLDWVLPESSGIEVLQWARDHFDWQIPVVFITRKDSDDDVVYALEQGADDYIAKPISKEVLMARVRAIERRVFGGKAEASSLKVGDYEFDPVGSTVKFRDAVLPLTEREIRLAILFFSNVGRLMSRDYILENVWGISHEVVTRTVDTHISRLRQKLELYPENGWQLKAVYQHGYRLEQMSSAGTQVG